MMKITESGTHALLIQCVLLILAIACTIVKPGFPAGWVMIASLLAGLASFLCGIAAAFSTRNLRWLGLSVAAGLIAFYSLLAGIAAGGHPGI